MKRRHSAMLLLPALVLSWPAPGETVIHTSTAVTEEMLFADDPKSWAKPKVVVPPEFPKDQIDANARGYVDIDVDLDPQGNVTNTRIVKSEPLNPAFEKVVLETTKMWLFNAAISKECIPVASTGNVRVWFEVRDGKGVVSVSGDVRPASESSKSVPKTSDWENRSATMRSIKYPIEAVRERVQTNLYAAVRVDAATGTSIGAEVTWIETSADARPKLVEDIKTAIVRSLKGAKYKSREGDNYRVCVPFSFRVN